MTEPLTITRVFAAPRERVWKAWTEPEQLARWWGKRGWTTPLATLVMDVRPGGAFRWDSVSEQGEMSGAHTYLEVVAPERLVFADGDGRATVTLVDLGDGRTEMTFHTTIPPAPNARAGLASAFDRLADQLTTSKEPA